MTKLEKAALKLIELVLRGPDEFSLDAFLDARCDYLYELHKSGGWQ